MNVKVCAYNDNYMSPFVFYQTQGKSKMSKSQFIKLNRAINGCEPLDETCLSSIYDEIEGNIINTFIYI